MRKFNYKFLGLAALAMAFTACEDGDLTSTGEVEAAMGELYVSAESNVSQIYRNVDEAMRTFDFSANPSVPITIDNATFDRDASDPNKYILDYGTGTATRGKVIEGAIEMTLTGANYLDMGTTVDVSLANFKEDDKPVSGSIFLENMGNNKFDMDVTAFTMEDNTSADDGGPKTFVLNTDKSLEWSAGSATPTDVSDDVYSIIGTADATYDNSNYTFDVVISKAMVIDNTCTYRLTEGVFDLDIATTVDPNPLTFNKATIDFIAGDGGNQDGCDKFFDLLLKNTETESELSTTRQFNGF